MVQRTAVCAFRPPLAEYTELLRGERGTPLPFRLVHSKMTGVRARAYRLRTAEPGRKGRKPQDRAKDSEELAPALHGVKRNPNSLTWGAWGPWGGAYGYQGACGASCVTAVLQRGWLSRHRSEGPCCRSHARAL